MADVSVDATISTSTARGMRAVVFPGDLIGYVFYLDSSGVLSYSKTTDGGAVWGAAVAVDGAAATTTVAFDVWFDKWTPGDTGTLIHVWWFDSTNDIVRWRTLNTSGDTLGTVRTVFTAASAVAGRGAFISGTKTRSGYLYCAYDIDAGVERGFHRSTDSGTTWSTNLATTFVEATLDTCKLFPASGTGDDNDCWALYYDASATALTLKLWDSSAVAQVESATIGVAHTDGATDLTGQFGYDGAVRHTDGHLIVAALSGRDVAASQHQVFDITSTSSIATLTAIAASTDDHYYPQVFINQGTGTIFVAYNGKRDGSEVMDTTTKVYYTYSTNGGTTWTAGDTAYMEGAAGIVLQVWTPMSGSRFYCVWRVAGTLLGNKVTSLIQLGAQGVTIAATSVANAPTDVTPGAVTVTGDTIGIGSSVNAPSAVTPVVSAQTIYSTARVFYTETLLFEHNTGGGANTTIATPGRNNSQTISGHSGLITSVSLLWQIQNTPVDSLYLEIRESTFNGTLLATSQRIPSTSIPATFDWVNFPLLTTVTLAAGTTYWIEIYRTTLVSTGSNQYLVRGSSGDVYLGGEEKDLAGATWIAGWDLRFRLYTGTSHTVEIVVPAAQDITATTIGSGSVLTGPTAFTYNVSGQTIYSTARVLYTETLLFETSGAVGIYHTLGAVVGRRFCQTISGHAGVVTSISLFMDRSADPTYKSAAYLEIRESALNGTLLATSLSMPYGAIATSEAWLNFPVPGGVALTSGTTYWIEIYVSAIETPGSYHLIGSTDNSYAGGTHTKQALVAVVDAAWDWLFRLYTGTSHTVEAEVGAADQAVTGDTIGAGSSAAAPTITVGAVTVVGATLTTGSVVTAPTVAPGLVTVAGSTVPTGLQVRVPTVAAGPVAVTGVTLTSASQVFAPPTLAVGPVTVVGGTRPTSQQVNAPTLQAVALGVTVTSGSGAFSPTLALGVSTLALGSTSQVFAASLAAGVTIPTIAVGSLVRVPTVVVGAVTLTGATQTTTAQVFVVTVSVGPVTVTGATRPLTSQVFSPTVIVGATTIVGATLSSTLQMLAPTVLGAGTLGTATLPSTVQLFSPTVIPAAIGVSGSTITSTLQLIAPTVTPGTVTVSGPTRVTTVQTFAPTVIGAGAIGVGALGSTEQMFVPVVELASIQMVVGASVSLTSVVFGPVVGTGKTITTVSIARKSIAYPPRVSKAPLLTRLTSTKTTVRYLVTASAVTSIVSMEAGVTVVLVQEDEGVFVP